MFVIAKKVIHTCLKPATDVIVHEKQYKIEIVLS